MIQSAVARASKRADIAFFGPIVLFAIVTRVVLLAVNWFTLLILPPVSGSFWDTRNLIPSSMSLNGWALWDGVNYIHIAAEGYGPYDPSVKFPIHAFFPGYSLLVRPMAALIGDSSSIQTTAVAAIIVSNLCFLASVLVFAAIVRSAFSDTIASTAAMLMCVVPVSFFFSTAYTESLFQLCVLLAFYFSMKNQVWPASLAILFAGATRLFGLALIPAILLIIWRRDRDFKRLVIPCIVGPLGTLAFFLWNWWKHGDFLLYFTTQANWGTWQDRLGIYIDRLMQDPSAAIHDHGGAIVYFYVALALCFAATLPLVWKVTDPGIALFSTIIVIFHLVYTWNSVGRYMLPAIGCYIAVAWLLHHPKCPKGLEQSLLVAGAMLMVLLNILHVRGFWVI